MVNFWNYFCFLIFLVIFNDTSVLIKNQKLGKNRGKIQTLVKIQYLIIYYVLKTTRFLCKISNIFLNFPTFQILFKKKTSRFPQIVTISENMEHVPFFVIKEKYRLFIQDYAKK